MAKEITKVAKKTEKVEKKTPEPKVKKVSKAVISKELKKNAKDIDVEIINLSNGTVLHQRHDESISLEYPGDVTTVSLDFLLNLRNKGLLENLVISIIDIYEDGYEVEDVLELLGLTKLYKECSMTLESLDELIEKTTSQEFESLIEDADMKVIERITERAIILSRDGGFDSNYKRNILEEKLNNRYLFNVI